MNPPMANAAKLRGRWGQSLDEARTNSDCSTMRMTTPQVFQPLRSSVSGSCRELLSRVNQIQVRTKAMKCATANAIGLLKMTTSTIGFGRTFVGPLDNGHVIDLFADGVQAQAIRGLAVIENASRGVDRATIKLHETPFGQLLFNALKFWLMPEVQGHRSPLGRDQFCASLRESLILVKW